LNWQFKDNITSENHYTKNGFVFRKIQSPIFSGKIRASSNTLGIPSKELIATVTAGFPKHFMITTQQDHNYADGNSLITLKTKPIVDANNNIVPNGTLVNFKIDTEHQSSLFTSALTVDGVATTQLLHPELPQKWYINADVEGLARSNEIEFLFESAVNDFNISTEGSLVKVGPITSFMGQQIPDGIIATFSVNNKPTFEAKTVNGFVYFEIPISKLDKNKNLVQVSILGKEMEHLIWKE